MLTQYQALELEWLCCADCTVIILYIDHSASQRHRKAYVIKIMLIKTSPVFFVFCYVVLEITSETKK